MEKTSHVKKTLLCETAWMEEFSHIACVERYVDFLVFVFVTF